MEMPDAVAFATGTEEGAAIVRLCAAHKRPVIAFGTGTSLEGQVQAARGGICIDLSGMNAILEVNEADLDCRVQAGVTRKARSAERRVGKGGVRTGRSGWSPDDYKTHNNKNTKAIR